MGLQFSGQVRFEVSGRVRGEESSSREIKNGFGHRQEAICDNAQRLLWGKGNMV